MKSLLSDIHRWCIYFIYEQAKFKPTLSGATDVLFPGINPLRIYSRIPVKNHFVCTFTSII